MLNNLCNRWRCKTSSWSLLQVPYARSETHLSDVFDSVCNKMDDYVRATYKTSGELTLLRLIGPDGQMNPDLSKVDIVQDGDLNKSLKFYVGANFHILQILKSIIIKWNLTS